MIESGLESILQDFIDKGAVPTSRASLKDRRSGYIQSKELAGVDIEIKEIEDIEINQRKIRFFKNSENQKTPLLIYFHGGCFISGGLETHDKQMRILSSQTEIKIALPEYRLAPENKFPAAHDDCLNITKYLIQNAKKYGIDENNIILAGDSAGGNLALSVALSLEKKYQQKLKKLILIYPMVDPKATFPSMKTNGSNYIMTADAFTSGWEMYLNDMTENENERINLLNRNNYDGLPETHIITAELDPLRDEGEALYKKLKGNGIDTYCTRYFGTIHGFFQLSKISSSANKALTEITGILKGM
ncbi:MAG: alpha/beta hydrolase [Spirochaetales bacterium]|nr:alpha/beta hydrolase [Spirochaetales bacterium]